MMHKELRISGGMPESVHHIGRHDAAARKGGNTSVAVLPLSKRKEVSDMTLAEPFLSQPWCVPMPRNHRNRAHFRASAWLKSQS